MHLVDPWLGLVFSGAVGLSWLLLLGLGLPRWFTWLLDPPQLPADLRLGSRSRAHARAHSRARRDLT